MDFNEINARSSEIIGNSACPVVISSIAAHKGGYIVNDYYAIKILGHSSYFRSDSESDIVLEDGTIIGTVCIKPMSHLLDYSLITEAKFIAYLNDVSITHFGTQQYILYHSYVLIHKNYLDYYFKEFYDTAPIWGGFFHNKRTVPIVGLESHPLQIIAYKGLRYPSNTNRTTAIRAILEPFAFERFLKKYHQIELISDLFIVNKIKKLKDDLYGIGNLLSENSSNELNKLKLILKNKIVDYDIIATRLFAVTKYSVIAEEMFQGFDKKANPLNNTVFTLLLALTDFKIGSVKTIKKQITSSEYEEFIRDLAGYWIYRIRCSIAHQKIGEYILAPTQEAFLLFFAEPLIDSLLIQILQ